MNPHGLTKGRLETARQLRAIQHDLWLLTEEAAAFDRMHRRRRPLPVAMHGPRCWRSGLAGFGWGLTAAVVGGAIWWKLIGG